MKRKAEKKIYQRIAQERIKILFNLAETNSITNPERSERYLFLAKQISMKANVPIPQELKRKYCRSCFSFLIPGRTSKISLDSKNKIKKIICLSCGKIYRIPYSKKN